MNSQELSTISQFSYEGNDDLSFGLHKVRILCILSISSSVLSILSGLFFFYIYYRVKYLHVISLHLFRHDLIYYLISINMFKAVLSIIYPSLSLSNVYYLVTYKTMPCSVLGFFIAAFNSMSDYINFIFGIHISLLFFKPNLNSIYETSINEKAFFQNFTKVLYKLIYGPKPKFNSISNSISNSRLSRMNSSLNSPIHNTRMNNRLNQNNINNDKLIIYEGGLYKWRKIILSIILIVPIIQSSFIYIDSKNYVSFGSYCYVPSKTWCRLLMNWFARYVILISMVIIYISIYIYITLKYRELKNIFQKSSISVEDKSISFKIHNFAQKIISKLIPLSKKINENDSPIIKISQHDKKDELVVKQIPIESLRNSAYFSHIQSKRNSYNLEPSISPKNINFPQQTYKNLNRNSYLIENSIIFNNLNNLNNEINQLNIKNLKIRKSKNLSQIKLILIYPFAYLLILLFQFISQIYKYPSFGYQEPFGLQCLDIIFQNIDVFIYLIAFLIKENPINFTKNTNIDDVETFNNFESFTKLNENNETSEFNSMNSMNDLEINEINEVQLKDFIINSKLANNIKNFNDRTYILDFNEFLNDRDHGNNVNNGPVKDIGNFENYTMGNSDTENRIVEDEFEEIDMDEGSINLVDFLRA